MRFLGGITAVAGVRRPGGVGTTPVHPDLITTTKKVVVDEPGKRMEEMKRRLVQGIGSEVSGVSAPGVSAPRSAVVEGVKSAEKKRRKFRSSLGSPGQVQVKSLVTVAERPGWEGDRKAVIEREREFSERLSPPVASSSGEDAFSPTVARRKFSGTTSVMSEQVTEPKPLPQPTSRRRSLRNSFSALPTSLTRMSLEALSKSKKLVGLDEDGGETGEEVRERRRGEEEERRKAREGEKVSFVFFSTCFS